MHPTHDGKTSFRDRVAIIPGKPELYTNSVRRGPLQTPGRPFGVHVFLFSFLLLRIKKSNLVYTGPLFGLFTNTFGVYLCPPFLPRFFPSSPFRPCSLSHHFPPLHLPLYPLFLTPGNSDLGTPLILALFSVRWAHWTSTRHMLRARCFQHGHFGRTSSTLYLTLFQSLGRHASARRIVSCKGLCVSSLCPQIPHVPALPHLLGGS